jgi:hypothetical protein
VRTIESIGCDAVDGALLLPTAYAVTGVALLFLFAARARPFSLWGAVMEDELAAGMG